VFDRISLNAPDAGAPPIPVGGPGNDLIAIGSGRRLSGAGVRVPPVVIGVPVFGV